MPCSSPPKSISRMVSRNSEAMEGLLDHVGWDLKTLGTLPFMTWVRRMEIDYVKSVRELVVREGLFAPERKGMRRARHELPERARRAPGRRAGACASGESRQLWRELVEGARVEGVLRPRCPAGGLDLPVAARREPELERRAEASPQGLREARHREPGVLTGDVQPKRRQHRNSVSPPNHHQDAAPETCRGRRASVRLALR
jgi:hypothetical protein